MNWLIYIAGFFVGGFIIGKVFHDYEDKKVGYMVFVWLMIWIWVCWKFIR